MGPHPFIFSNEPRYRLKRHLTFWAIWWITQAFLYSFAAGWYQSSYSINLFIASLNALGFMAPHIFLAYSLMYFVVPRLLLKEKYISAAIATLLLFVATGAISATIGVYLLPPLRTLIL